VVSKARKALGETLTVQMKEHCNANGKDMSELEGRCQVRDESE